MSRTPARFTQADAARTIRAAKQAGAGGVEFRPDGTIFVHLYLTLEKAKFADQVDNYLDQDRGAVL